MLVNILWIKNFYPRPPGGGRLLFLPTLPLPLNFYPRPPGGGRRILKYEVVYDRKFLSTPSGWRATTARIRAAQSHGNFYPRPPGGGRLWYTALLTDFEDFYPRPPGGGRREQDYGTPERNFISIHALRVEGDLLPRVRHLCQRHFYPRPPGGGRHESKKKVPRTANFYPRPPGGGRRTKERQDMESFRISIHALRVEGDAPHLIETALTKVISIHALRVEGDGAPLPRYPHKPDFYPRPPGGGRL